MSLKLNFTFLHVIKEPIEQFFSSSHLRKDLLNFSPYSVKIAKTCWRGLGKSFCLNFFFKFSLCNAKTALNIHSPSQPFASHVYLNLQHKFYWHPQPARIGNFARRSNCNRDSFPLLCHDYHDRSHDLIGLHITLLQRTCSQDRTIVMVHAVTAHQI